MWKNRKMGQESPYIPMGPFKLRLPFIHYKLEWPDYFQGLLMCAVDLSAIPLMTELLGMPFEAALAVVILNGLFYLTHHLLGDPVIPGWITPAIPLLIAYCSQFPEGTERVHALVSFEMGLGILAVFLGLTGLAKRVVYMVPSSIKSGIIMGAGFAAVISVFEKGGKFDSFPITISICVGLAFYLIFSKHFEGLRTKNPFWTFISNLGVLPIILLAVIVAPLAGEAPWPTIEWGLINPDFHTLFMEYTPIGLGFPPLSMFLSALPMVFATYIVLFGDVLKTKVLLEEAVEKRPDEKVDYNENRAHLIFGARNALMGMIGPDVSMCGPIWGAMQVVLTERFKAGKKAMHSIFGGAGSFRLGTNTGLFILPIVSMVKPILGVALALTVLIQGYVSVRIGAMEARSHRDLGIAGVTGAVLATKGASWAFAVGIVLCFLIYGKDFFRGENDGLFQTANHDQNRSERKAS